MEKDFSADDERGGRKKEVVKSILKKDKKDRGYANLDENSEEETLIGDENKLNPFKVKKLKAFKIKKPKEKEKDDKKGSSSSKKDDKEKKKEEKEKDSKKDEHKVKDSKKKSEEKEKKEKKASKDGRDRKEKGPADTPEKRKVFGVPLVLAVMRSRVWRDVDLPAVVIDCIQHIESCGLHWEGIYRVSAVKSKVQALREAYNEGRSLRLSKIEPGIIACLLKQYLRELPENLLTQGLLPRFEEAAMMPDKENAIRELKRLVHELPSANRTVLGWLMTHIRHVVEKDEMNKMSLQNVTIVFSPTLDINSRVFVALFTFVYELFGTMDLKRSRMGASSGFEDPSAQAETPLTIRELQVEIAKQESLLNRLHAELARFPSQNSDKEEQLWEIQRYVTQLKRKLKMVTKVSKESRDESFDMVESPPATKSPDPPMEEANKKGEEVIDTTEALPPPQPSTQPQQPSAQPQSPVQPQQPPVQSQQQPSAQPPPPAQTQAIVHAQQPSAQPVNHTGDTQVSPPPAGVENSISPPRPEEAKPDLTLDDLSKQLMNLRMKEEACKIFVRSLRDELHQELAEYRQLERVYDSSAVKSRRELESRSVHDKHSTQELLEVLNSINRRRVDLEAGYDQLFHELIRAKRESAQIQSKIQFLEAFRGRANANQLVELYGPAF